MDKIVNKIYEIPLAKAKELNQEIGKLVEGGLPFPVLVRMGQSVGKETVPLIRQVTLAEVKRFG